MYIYIYIHNIYYVNFTNAIVFQSFNCFHLRKGLYWKRREHNNVILRAVSLIALLRCRLIYSQQYAPYEHIYIYTISSFEFNAMRYCSFDRAKIVICALVSRH